jgi:hypothetical protein
MNLTQRFPALTVTGVPATASADILESTKLPGGFDLPASYRDFAQTFGYGRLGDLLFIYMPLETKFCNLLLGRNNDLRDLMQEGLRDDLWEFGPDGSPELVSRLSAFGISENGHILTWDIGEKTGPNEYAIYAIASKLLAIRRAADNLYEFVAKLLDQRVKSVLGSGYEPLPATFEQKAPYPGVC